MAKKYKKEKQDGDKHGDGEKKDAVMMRDGKLLIRKDGKKAPLTQDMTLPNGTKVMKNGQLKMKDGSTRMLAEGESLYMDGTIKMKKKKDGKDGKKEKSKKED